MMCICELLHILEGSPLPPDPRRECATTTCLLAEPCGFCCEIQIVFVVVHPLEQHLLPELMLQGIHPPKY